MRRSPDSLARVVAITLALLLIGTPIVTAQGSRMNDKDIESLMKNLQDDSKKFRSAFNSGVGKSTIRKTSQEKDAKTLVERFEKETEGLLKEFKDKKKADSLPTVVATSSDIDKLVSTLHLGDATEAAWSKVKTELGTLKQQFDVN